MGLHASSYVLFSKRQENGAWKKNDSLFFDFHGYICCYFVLYIWLYTIICYLSCFPCYYLFAISGSTVEATTTTTTTSSLGVTINDTTITTTEKMIIVNTGENGSDTNNIANTVAVPTIAENDNSNNINY